jgi:excinuclease ABC subunit A
VVARTLLPKRASTAPLRAAERGAALLASQQSNESGDKSPHSQIRRVEWSIGDLLEATVDEAIECLALFADSKPAARAVTSLKLLQEVGLGYLRLGQPINTLSGGESQRLKLVRHLSEATQANGAARGKGGKGESESATSPLPIFTPAHVQETGKGASETSRQTLFLFDEPTTGLHFDDVRVLMKVYQRLVDAGHSVIVIEHNLDVIKCADWVIDLGPEAGDGGGQIVAQGKPEDIVSCAASHTGHALKSVLNQPTQGKT